MGAPSFGQGGAGKSDWRESVEGLKAILQPANCPAAPLMSGLGRKRKGSKRAHHGRFAPESGLSTIKRLSTIKLRLVSNRRCSRRFGTPSGVSLSRRRDHPFRHRRYQQSRKVSQLTLIMIASPHSTSTALFRGLLVDPVAALCNGNDPDWRRYICGTEERCIGLVIGEILINAPERVLG